MNMQFDFCHADDLLFCSFVDDDHFADPKDCTALFQAVILEALIDALWPHPRAGCADQEEARKWFDIDNEDFVDACNWASLEPASVINFYQARLNLCAWNDYQGALAGLIKGGNCHTRKYASAHPAREQEERVNG